MDRVAPKSKPCARAARRGAFGRSAAGTGTLNAGVMTSLRGASKLAAAPAVDIAMTYL